MMGIASQELLRACSVALKEFLGTTLGCTQTSSKGDTAEDDV
jgi:hypothetical protein